MAISASDNFFDLNRIIHKGDSKDNEILWEVRNKKRPVLGYN